MNAESYFSSDYSAARHRFRASAKALAWRLDAREIDARGPGGERLSIDAAISPHPDARPTLVVSSGLHGIEGFFGSAVQLALLDRWRTQPPDVRCVLLHALNPFGFAWLRRADDRNVDLNRNFLLDGEAYAGSPPGYGELDPHLNPPRPPAAWDPFVIRLLPAIVRRGVPAVRRAVASGQHEFPRGLFFGGDGPTQARRAIEQALSTWLAGSADVVHLDLHTGLGRWGQGTLLIDYPLSDRQRDRLNRWFGAEAVQMPGSYPSAYRARGGLGPWCVSRGFAPEYLFAYAEFGTFSSLRVLAGLRAENQAHHRGSRSDPATARAKARLKTLFCPPDPRWRARVIARSVELVARAIDGLAA